MLEHIKETIHQSSTNAAVVFITEVWTHIKFYVSSKQNDGNLNPFLPSNLVYNLVGVI